MHPFEERSVHPGSVGIHWFGQNSFALKDAAGTIVQVDPYFLRDRPGEKFIHASPPLVIILPTGEDRSWGTSNGM